LARNDDVGLFPERIGQREDEASNPGAYAVIGNQSPILYFENLSAQSGKPLLFTEIGYANDSGAAADPSASGNSRPDAAGRASGILPGLDPIQKHGFGWRLFLGMGPERQHIESRAEHRQLQSAEQPGAARGDDRLSDREWDSGCGGWEDPAMIRSYFTPPPPVSLPMPQARTLCRESGRLPRTSNGLFHTTRRTARRRLQPSRPTPGTIWPSILVNTHIADLHANAVFVH
jgi:hypothetical protein